MCDHNLINRVREYLAARGENYIDIAEMSDHLRLKYKEYGRRKKVQFQKTVKSAYDILCQEYSPEENSSSDENDEIIIEEPSLQDNNHLNDKLLEMYTPPNDSRLYRESTYKNDTIPISDESNSIEETIDKNISTPKNISAKKRKICNDKHTDTIKKKMRTETKAIESQTTFKNIGGIDNVLENVCKLLTHMCHPEVYKTLGVTPPRGLLLHGPPGCGKTLLAHAIAGEFKLPLIKIAGPELVAGVSGESEERIRNLFNDAIAMTPCILFIDEVDVITPNRVNTQREMERRIVAQMLSCLDDLAKCENADQLLLIGATNRADSLDPALRRAGRFDHEICLGIPSSAARKSILHVLCENLKLSSEFDFDKIAMNTPGFVGADLMALVREAAFTAANRSLYNNRKLNIGEEQTGSETELQKAVARLHNKEPLPKELLENLKIEMTDFKLALKQVQPSSKREGFATVPDVTWDDIGSLYNIRKELKMAILAPVKYATQHESLGLNIPAGVLLCGPPGCGKTLLAKAVANEAGINFISVKGPELLNMYVGESEKGVRQCFQRARNSTPCVIFFDEFDALCPKRSETGENSVIMRVVNQMLTEMDGVESRKGVFLLAASNRPDIIDPAVLRPGRLDKILYVGLPTPDDRIDILKAITKNRTKPLLSDDVNLETIGKSVMCNGYTGADLAALVREASVQALDEVMTNNTISENPVISVSAKHFEQAFSKIRPSVSKQDQEQYEALRKYYSPKESTYNKTDIFKI